MGLTHPPRRRWPPGGRRADSRGARTPWLLRRPPRPARARSAEQGKRRSRAAAARGRGPGCGGGARAGGGAGGRRGAHAPPSPPAWFRPPLRAAGVAGGPETPCPCAASPNTVSVVAPQTVRRAPSLAAAPRDRAPRGPSGAGSARNPPAPCRPRPLPSPFSGRGRLRPAVGRTDGRRPVHRGPALRCRRWTLRPPPSALGARRAKPGAALPAPRARVLRWRTGRGSLGGSCGWWKVSRAAAAGRGGACGEPRGGKGLEGALAGPPGSRRRGEVGDQGGAGRAPGGGSRRDGFCLTRTGGGRQHSGSLGFRRAPGRVGVSVSEMGILQGCWVW